MEAIVEYKIAVKNQCFLLAPCFTLIPTGCVKKYRKMAATSECNLCGADEDTWEHALLRCTMSRCIWAQLDEEVTKLIATVHFSDPKHWASFMCSNIPQVDGVRILVTCWPIWHARRKAIYDEIFQSPLATMAMVNRLLEELEIVEGFELKGRHQQQPKQKNWALDST
uniref:Uncharacterized protein n=1 Tax=Arundo donax TaxID=35708 RepID=A0A0A9CJ82_ARUDO